MTLAWDFAVVGAGLGFKPRPLFGPDIDIAFFFVVRAPCKSLSDRKANDAPVRVTRAIRWALCFQVARFDIRRGRAAA